MAGYDYDLVVLGSGPAGHRAAIQAAKLRKKVALAEPKAELGGACINTGTIPSKTVREAVLHLSGFRERGVYGASYRVKDQISMADLRYRVGHVVRHEIEVSRHQLQRNGVDLVPAWGGFVDPHTVRFTDGNGAGQRDVTSERVVIAVGTYPTKNPEIPFEDGLIVTSDGILDLSSMPRSLTVIGGGVIGCEYATIFAALGVRVTLIDQRAHLLRFIDTEITDALVYLMQQHRVTLRLGETVEAVEAEEDGGRRRARVRLKSGKQVASDAVLYAIGRTGAVDRLHLEAAGLSANNRGQMSVNENYQTEQPHIYAVGDVIGFPSLASTSMEQGRLAACHSFGVACQSFPETFPYGIYTIPEISTVGKNEAELTEEGIPYEIGKARYREISRGQIIGDETGLLKLMFHLETRKLLGVHIIGEGASELVHIGQAVLSLGGTIDYFVDTVFNYPTLAECYKVAALDGINRLA